VLRVRAVLSHHRLQLIAQVITDLQYRK